MNKWTSLGSAVWKHTTIWLTMHTDFTLCITKQIMWTYSGDMYAGTSNDRKRYPDADERQCLAEQTEMLINVQDEFHSKGVQNWSYITNEIKISEVKETYQFRFFSKCLLRQNGPLLSFMSIWSEKRPSNYVTFLILYPYSSLSEHFFKIRCCSHYAQISNSLIQIVG